MPCTAIFREGAMGKLKDELLLEFKVVKRRVERKSLVLTGKVPHLVLGPKSSDAFEQRRLTLTTLQGMRVEGRFDLRRFAPGGDELSLSDAEVDSAGGLRVLRG
jgi:hypothetical protein